MSCHGGTVVSSPREDKIGLEKCPPLPRLALPSYGYQNLAGDQLSSTSQVNKSLTRDRDEEQLSDALSCGCSSRGANVPPLEPSSTPCALATRCGTAINADKGRVKIHYSDLVSRYDEWIAVSDSERLRQWDAEKEAKWLGVRVPSVAQRTCGGFLFGS